MKWYEADQQRFEKEYGQLTAQGLKVSITNAGFGDVYAICDQAAGKIDVLIHFSDGYPGEPPRYYFPQGDGMPVHADGAVDLKAIGIEWTEQMSAVDVLSIITQNAYIHSQDESEVRTNRLRLRNLTAYLKRCGDLGYGGRDREIEIIKECMIREGNAGCVLLGKPGVGKTALAFKFIQRSASGDVPPLLRSMKFYELRLEDIVASSKYVGDAEREVKLLIERPGILALFVDEIHRLSSPLLTQVADAIKPEMASGKIRIIGASTHDEWRQVQDGALRRRLIPIEVTEPGPEETFMMIRSRLAKLSQHYGMDFSDETVRAAIGMGKIYVGDLAFPAKAMDILDRAAAAQTVQKYGPSRKSEATPERGHYA